MFSMATANTTDSSASFFKHNLMTICREYLYSQVLYSRWQWQASCQYTAHLTVWGIKFISILKNAIPTSQKAHCVSITNTHLIPFKEIIAAYYDNNTKHINCSGGNIQSFWMFEHVVHIITTVLQRANVVQWLIFALNKQQNTKNPQIIFCTYFTQQV